MKTPVLIVTVVLIHVLAIGSVLFIQGCGTRRAAGPVEPPPAPVMPPRQDTSITPAPRPVFQPPIPVEPAPSMMVPTDGRSYTVQKGDSLSKIASRLGVSARELAEINNIKDPNRIVVGQVLALPDYAKSVPASAPVAPRVERAVVPEGGAMYVVQAGDSLSKIAVKHGVRVNDIREANKLSGDLIRVGQKLVIPGSSARTATQPKPAAAPKPAPAPAPAPVPAPVPAPAPAPAPAPSAMLAPMPPPAPVAAAPAAAPRVDVPQDQPLDYTVQDNDTLESIATLFIVKVEDIMALNGITDAKAPLKVGQKLKIPPTDI